MFLMEQEAFFKAVDLRRADHVFFTDAADGQPSFEVVGKDQQNHGERVRKVGHDKIRQERVGLPAEAAYARDSQTEHLRLLIKESDKVAFIAAPFFTGSFRAAGRADDKKQRGLIQGLPK